MVKLTLHDRFVAALIATGHSPGIDPAKNARSSKYTVLDRSIAPGWFFFVGKAGSLRVGRNIKNSIPISDKMKKILLEV